METRNQYRGRIEQNEVFEAAYTSVGAWTEYPLNTLMNSGVGHPNNVGDRALRVTVVPFTSTGTGTELYVARSEAAGMAGNFKKGTTSVAALLDFDYKDRASSVWLQTVGGAMELNIEIEYTLRA